MNGGMNMSCFLSLHTNVKTEKNISLKQKKKEFKKMKIKNGTRRRRGDRRALEQQDKPKFGKQKQKN
jgi:hypothetical protein